MLCSVATDKNNMLKLIEVENMLLGGLLLLQLVAEIVLGKEPSLDLQPFRPERF